jgi:hypothetical protein
MGCASLGLETSDADAFTAFAPASAAEPPTIAC